MALKLEFRGLEKDGKMWACEYLYNGKPGVKKIPSWGDENLALIKILNATNPGEIIHVTSKKNEKTGYSDWTEIQRDDGNQTRGSGGVSSAPTMVSSSGNRGNDRSFETVEERARKQVYIVRQSSLSNGIEILKSRGVPFGVVEAVSVAEELTQWVLNGSEQEDTSE